MKKIAIPFVFGLAILLTTQCTSDNEKEFYGGVDCDTLNVSYSQVIDPILNDCKSCHFAGSNGTGVVLATYEGVVTVAENGRLLGAIKHQSGFKAMPQGGGKLSDCSIAKIEAWINKGTPND